MLVTETFAYHFSNISIFETYFVDYVTDFVTTDSEKDKE